MAQDGEQQIGHAFGVPRQPSTLPGSFHKISVKHLDRYLEELEWRFNNRNNPNIFPDTLKRILTTNTLTYKEFISDAG